MIMQFQKKPVVIEAVQWTGGELFFAQVVKPFCPTAVYDAERSVLTIPTLEGDHRADLSDWIIKGVKGECYPCKPDIFEMTYTPVESTGNALACGADAPHPTVPVQVWVDVDEGCVSEVNWLNSLPGVRTFASCQGTIGEGGAEPYRAQIMAAWPTDTESLLRERYDVEILGDCWGYLRPKAGADTFSEVAPEIPTEASTTQSVSSEAENVSLSEHPLRDPEAPLATE